MRRKNIQLDSKKGFVTLVRKGYNTYKSSGNYSALRSECTEQLRVLIFR